MNAVDRKEPMMKYLVLMYADEQRWESATEAEQEAVMAAHGAFDEAVRARAEMLGGEALAPADTTTTLGPTKTGTPRAATDGPYAETVEHLGGYYVVEAADLDQMIELCHALPDDYTLEIRPIVELDL
ncbi:MAG: YciI family protein [Ornithinimicrobium sp.]